MKVKWSVFLGEECVDCGTVEADHDREVLERILRGDLGQFTRRKERCYRVTAGSALASAYGDEFSAVAGSSNIDESKLEDAAGGHLFLTEEQKAELARTAAEKALEEGWKDQKCNVVGQVMEAARRMEAEVTPGRASGSYDGTLRPSDLLRRVSGGMVSVTDGQTGIHRGTISESRGLETCTHPTRELRTTRRHDRQSTLYQCGGCGWGIHVNDEDVALDPYAAVRALGGDKLRRVTW